MYERDAECEENPTHIEILDFQLLFIEVFFIISYGVALFYHHFYYIFYASELSDGISSTISPYEYFACRKYRMLSSMLKQLQKAPEDMSID